MQDALLASLSVEECREGRPEHWGAVGASEPFPVIAAWCYQEKGDRRRK